MAIGEELDQTPINLKSLSIQEHFAHVLTCFLQLLTGVIGVRLQLIQRFLEKGWFALIFLTLSATIRRHECFSHLGQHANRHPRICRVRCACLPNAKGNFVWQPCTRHRAWWKRCRRGHHPQRCSRAIHQNQKGKIGVRLQLIYERAEADGVIGVWVVRVRPRLSRQPQTLTTLIPTDSATAWCSCTARCRHPT